MYERKKCTEKKRMQKKKVFAIVPFLCFFAGGFLSCFTGFCECRWINRRCVSEELCEEEKSGFILRRTYSEDYSSEAYGSTSQICKEEFDLYNSFGIEGSIGIETEDGNDRLCFYYEFENNGNKDVVSFVVVFFVFDENGESCVMGKNYIILKINERVQKKACLKGCVDISDRVYFDSDSDYCADYLYLSEVTFDDGLVQTLV